VSGEATSRRETKAEPLERAFGARAACSRCGVQVDHYRVIAVFLHDTVSVRAYCHHCYPGAVDGDYHARGDGLVLDYAGFSQRFGAPGPPPPVATPVDRMLTALVRDPALDSLTPHSEAAARRLRMQPYRFRVGFLIDGTVRTADLTVTPEGRVEALDGDASACARTQAVVGTI